MKDIMVIVPSLDPDESIMGKFLKDLKKSCPNILVIDDGSNKTHEEFFNSLEEKGITVLRHFKNLGKGRALKNAFNYILLNCPDIVGSITCDCDGQHSVEDIKKCGKALHEYPEKLILGVRNFDADYVPIKSKFGNKLTRDIFKTFIGLDITDTQTGLRGFSRDLMYKFVDAEGERYEYETEMLIKCKENSIALEEVEIETIYLNCNENTHFNPLKDSIRIYKTFSKYFLGTFSYGIIDIILFAAFLGVLTINTKILAATILARLISGFYFYIINSSILFKDMDSNSLIRYSTFAILQMIISGCFVTYLSDLLGGSVIIIKIVVDIFIWIINLIVQKEII